MRQLQRLFWLTGMFSVMLASAAQADSLEVSTISAPEVVPVEELNRSEEPEPATTVEEWIGQIEAQEQPDAAAKLAQALTEITGVQVSETENGLELILEAAEPLAEPQTSVTGNALTADIPNAVLALPDEDAFEQFDPAEGIALVSVTNEPGVGGASPTENRVRVSITGVDAPPIAEVRREAQGLVFGVAPGTETDATQGEDAIQVVVTGEQETGYRVPNASTATRTDTPILNIPASIQVIPRQILEDQQATQLNEALRNASSVSTRNSSLSLTESVIIRGFDSSFNIFTNGFRNITGGSAAVRRDVANIEQIEVLRGPASVLYGRGEPGGTINIITKQPLREAYYAVEGAIGSFDFYRPSLDISGPLNSDATVLYRLNAAYENSGAFVDFFNVERFFVAPVLSFQLGENTTLSLEGSYSNDSRPGYQGLPAVGTVLSNPLGDVPRSRNLGDPDIGNVNFTVGEIGYRLEHRFSDNLILRNAFRADFFNQDRNEQLLVTGLQADNRTVNRRASRTTGSNVQFYTLQTELIGTIQTGSIEQELLLGVELGHTRSEGRVFSASAPPIDLFNPVYGLPLLNFNEVFNAVETRNILGVYAQDLISIDDNLTILLGGRFDLVDYQYEDNLDDLFSVGQQDTAFSPRFGIVYQPIPPVSLYASYSRSFSPLGAFGSRNVDGEPFKPTTGESLEAGVKAEFLDGRLLATLAAYQLTRQNLITDDPDRPDFSIQIGEERSRGVELDVIGEILPGLNLIANYAYTDALVTEDNRGFEGNRPNNVPQHSGSLWLTYEIQDGNLQGLGFGTGVFVVGERKGDRANTFDLPGYVRTDAAIYYQRENWQAGLNFRNLFGVDYFESASNRNRVNPGAPFTVLGSISVNF